jgi:regulator of cell morphogenesis and NO signaling
MTITEETTVGSVATEHPLATRVFARHGIDFCCGGGRPISEICEEKDLSVESLLAELESEISSETTAETRWDLEPMGDLIQHILHTYHDPHREEMTRLEAMARKVHTVHGDKDPRIKQILDTFVNLKVGLEQHMLKEEQVLFPMILAGHGAMTTGPISVMEVEHDDAGKVLRRLRELTDNYVPPEYACNTWRALWAGLADFERAVHEHIHLENNILHPRAQSE